MWQVIFQVNYNTKKDSIPFIIKCILCTDRINRYLKSKSEGA